MSSSRFAPELIELGLTPFFHQQLLAFGSELTSNTSLYAVGRIACEHRGAYEVATATSVLRVTLSGRLTHALSDDVRPVVGDWVVCEPADPVGRIQHLLARQSVLRRLMVDGSSRPQTLAANVDLCCIVSAIADEEADVRTQRRALNPRRIARYLRMARDSRVDALVLINKVDLVPPQRRVALRDALQRELPGAAVELVSARHEDGLAVLRQRLSAGVTAVLLGSSGVGKSSIVNALLGREAKRVGETRHEDARGRHTTTERELMKLAGGGTLIDTPGMRELALWADQDTDVSVSGFDDLDHFAEICRFTDCRHQSEPGCAVRAAIDRGALPEERLEQAHKLERELLHQRARADARLQASKLNERKALARAMRVKARTKDRDG